MKTSLLTLCVALGVVGLISIKDRARAQSEDAAAPQRSKKGVCLTTGRENEKVWRQRVASLNVGWHYSWGPILPEPAPKGVEFVPMIWGFWGASPDFLKVLDELRAAKLDGSRTHLLAFNEPDGKDQANMSVDKALEAWPFLEKTGLRLGSPGAVHADKEWMQQFMTRANEKGYRVDFVCVHWYGSPHVEPFIERLKKIHEMYQKPLWITEFAPADWNAKTVEENRHTPEQVLRFMRELLPRLDQLDFVERYAWFGAWPDSPALGPSALFNKDGSLTALGEFYASHRSTTQPTIHRDK